MKEKNLIVTPQQVNAWKKEHGPDSVFCYKTKDNVTGYFLKPDRKIIAFATGSSKGDSMRFKEILAENCWLGGDDRIIREDKYFLGLSQCILDLVEIVEGELVKA